MLMCFLSTIDVVLARELAKSSGFLGFQYWQIAVGIAVIVVGLIVAVPALVWYANQGEPLDCKESRCEHQVYIDRCHITCAGHKDEFKERMAVMDKKIQAQNKSIEEKKREIEEQGQREAERAKARQDEKRAVDEWLSQLSDKQ